MKALLEILKALYSIKDAISNKKNNSSDEGGDSNEQNVDNGLFGADAIQASFFHSDTQSYEQIIYDNINDVINDLIYGRKTDDNDATNIQFLYKDKIDDSDLVGKALYGVINLRGERVGQEYFTDLKVKFLNEETAGNYICVIDPYYNVDDYYIIRRKTDDD